jgi:excisionase family DNA binding protein
MDIKELAEQLGVSVPTLYRWRAAGVDLPPAVTIGTRLRWRQETVAAWAAAREASAERAS